MPRRKSQDRKIGKHSKEHMKLALQAVEAGVSIRKAAKMHDIAYPTFRRYAKKRREQGENISLVPRYDINRVFSEEQENVLVEYYKECALMFYGLSVKDCRQVAFEMAKNNNLKMPSTWERDGLAGLEWFRSFKQRHPEITVKQPEPVSLARATAFNPESVNIFFDNLQTVIERQPQFADGTRLFNLDETSTTTVQKPQKVVAPRGVSVGKVTSGEKGTLVTTCCMVSAAGYALPPAIIFPRKNFKNMMLNGAPPGSLGLANASGWMTSELFIEVIKHFVKHTRTSLEDPSLLLMDNHESHLSIEALDYAKTSGVTVLTFHPHTTNKLQPLDVGLMGPFKTFYNSAMESWMLRNPGRPVTIYEVAGFIGQAYPKAMTPTNIASAFSKCGIFPFDRYVFTDIDYLPSTVTDRPAPENSNPSAERSEINLPRELTDHTNNDVAISNASGERDSIDNTNNNISIPISPLSRENSPSVLANTSETHILILNESIVENTKSPGTFITPKEFRPPIKAGPRCNKRKRKAGRSIIATDTPEKDQIAANRAATKRKKEAAANSGNFKRKVLKVTQDSQPSTSGLKKAKRPKKEESETDESEEEIELESETDVGENSTDDDDDVLLNDSFLPLRRKPKEGDFVLILLESKKQTIYYVAKIVEIAEENEYSVSFLKLKKGEQPCFIFPLEPDLAVVNLSEIKFLLPPPKSSGTKRLTKYFFKVNFSRLNVK